MPERRCGTCVHANLGDRVLNAGKPSEWVDRLGYCSLAAKHITAMVDASNALGRAPQCLGIPGAAMIGPDHGGACGVWEERV